MSTITDIATGNYLYCFLKGSDADAAERLQWTGLNGAPIEVIKHGDIAVVLSAIPNEKLRPQRKLLAAHQAVVQMAAVHFSSLPMAFGLIADSKDRVVGLIERNQEAILDQLNTINKQVEFNLVVEWNVGNLFAFMVETHAELMEARERIVSGNASRDEQIALGQTFESILNQERAAHTDKVTQILAPLCGRWISQPPRSESEIMRLAMLVPPEQESELEKGIHQAASHFDEKFSFKYNGPWPPYSFINLALNVED